MSSRSKPARGRPWGRDVALLCASLVLAHAPRGALAQSAPQGGAPQTAEAAREARERFQRGVELYKEGDYRAALLEFRHAYRLSPNPVVLFNIAQSHYELRDYAGAKTAFETSPRAAPRSRPSGGGRSRPSSRGSRRASPSSR
jgi:tetratricopeptide (TPR) repeat protein